MHRLGARWSKPSLAALGFPISGAGQGGTGFERREIALLREQLADRDETIRDLRTRLDSEVEERRRAQERLMALLMHRQAGSVPAMQRPETPFRGCRGGEGGCGADAKNRRRDIALV